MKTAKKRQQINCKSTSMMICFDCFAAFISFYKGRETRDRTNAMGRDDISQPTNRTFFLFSI